MGFISDLFGGGDAADASVDAAELQLQGVREGIAAQQEALETTRADLAPFRQFGQNQLASLSGLLNDPNAQKDFVLNNPFFEALSDDAERRIFNARGAVGKKGSGGTAEALRNSILLLGNDLVGEQVGRQFNAATLGQNAAAGQATATQNTGRSIADLTLQGANAQAAGQVGAANAQTQALQSAADTAIGVGTILALSDRKEKEDIKPVGDGWYFFRYKGSSKMELGKMAQENPHAVINIGGKLYLDYGKV